jgi:hypothetical protein
VAYEKALAERNQFQNDYAATRAAAKP